MVHPFSIGSKADFDLVPDLEQRELIAELDRGNVDFLSSVETEVIVGVAVFDCACDLGDCAALFVLNPFGFLSDRLELADIRFLRRLQRVPDADDLVIFNRDKGELLDEPRVVLEADKIGRLVCDCLLYTSWY